MVPEEKKNEKEYSPEYLNQIQQFKKRIRYEYLRLCRSRKMKKAQEAKVKYAKCFFSIYLLALSLSQVESFFASSVMLRDQFPRKENLPWKSK